MGKREIRWKRERENEWELGSNLWMWNPMFTHISSDACDRRTMCSVNITQSQNAHIANCLDCFSFESKYAVRVSTVKAPDTLQWYMHASHHQQRQSFEKKAHTHGNHTHFWRKFAFCRHRKTCVCCETMWAFFFCCWWWNNRVTEQCANGVGRCDAWHCFTERVRTLLHVTLAWWIYIRKQTVKVKGFESKTQ